MKRQTAQNLLGLAAVLTIPLWLPLLGVGGLFWVLLDSVRGRVRR